MDKSEVKSTKSIQEDVEFIKSAKAKMAYLKKQLDETQARVTEFMGDATTLVDVAGTAIIGTYNERGGTLTFDKDAFKESHPKLWDKFQKPGSVYRVFLPK